MEYYTREKGYEGERCRKADNIKELKMVVVFALIVCFSKLFPGGFLPGGVSAAVSVATGFLLTFFVFYRRNFNKALEGSFQTERGKRVKLVRGIQDCFFAVFCGGIIIWIIAFCADFLGVDIFGNIAVIPKLKGAEGIIFGIYILFVAPIISAIVFFDVLLKRLMPFGKNVAIYVSAALYGLFSGTYILWIISFFVGVALAKSRIKSKSVMTTIKISLWFSCLLNLAIFFGTEKYGWIFLVPCIICMALGGLRFLMGRMRVPRHAEVEEIATFTNKQKYMILAAAVVFILEDAIYLLFTLKI